MANLDAPVWCSKHQHCYKHSKFCVPTSSPVTLGTDEFLSFTVLVANSTLSYNSVPSAECWSAVDDIRRVLFWSRGTTGCLKVRGSFVTPISTVCPNFHVTPPFSLA